MFDDNEFFRHATLRICGNLAVEEAMRDCVRFLAAFIPVDRMFLQVYEADLAAMRTLAMASAGSGEEVDLLTPMPEEARSRIQQSSGELESEVVVIDSPERNPVADEMLRFHGIEGWSILRINLATEGDRIGGVVLVAEGANRYTEEHARLLPTARRAIYHRAGQYPAASRADSTA